MAASVAGGLLWLGMQVLAQAGGETPIIDISGAGFQALPVAVPGVKVVKGAAAGADGNPLANDPVLAAANDLSKVLRDDLALCGIFRILDPAAYLPNPQKEGLALGTFNMGDWINVGASALLKVGLSRDGDKSTLEARLYDVAQARELTALKYSGPPEAERRMAHRIADEVYKHYTHEPGVFRTRLVASRQSKPGGKKDLWVMDMDGHNGRPLNLADGLNLLPSWDPSGSSLLFTTFLKGNPDVYRVGVSGGGLTRISGRTGNNMGAVTSPDGKFIALTLSKDGNSELYLLDASGKEVRRLTHDPQIDSSASFSPDGKRLAFVSSRGGTPQIYVMDVAAGDKSARRLTFQGNYNQTPDWSPRGDKILFTARDERLVFDVFVVDVNTGKIDRLTQDQGNNEEPSWSPNGRLVVFTSTRNRGRSQVYLMTSDGAVQRAITNDRANYSTPAWGPMATGE